ncbi:MAG TPA: YbhB/YbcL family Raf kinase inhibitor-like protein [Caulobacteraceae bacterium]|jgi:para-nitrobenzyl esterase|nr:YbhB/YbcL family Raf kinase inhibitor-like protein [Caulobacteraceae bacterium]
MKAYLSAAALALGLQLGVAPAVFAQGAPPPPAVEAGASLRALVNVPAKGGATLTVSSPAFKAGGDIPFENTMYRGNVFPGLSWTKGPAATKSYVVIMQDTDAMMRGAPILHWTLYNVPATVTKLDPAMTAPPAGASYGPNVRGPNSPYAGPRPPAGPKHRYHLQVFALDTTLKADPAMTYEALTGAMKDHVLASGELIGLGQFDPTAPPQAPRPPAN